MTKCIKCGGTQEVVEVQTTHYTDKVTEPMCIYCRSSAQGNTIMQQMHTQLKKQGALKEGE